MGMAITGYARKATSTPTMRKVYSPEFREVRRVSQDGIACSRRPANSRVWLAGRQYAA